jgi:hypothetical protein
LMGMDVNLSPFQEIRFGRWLKGHIDLEHLAVCLVTGV